MKESVQETKELKRTGFIGYRLKNNLYSLVNFETNETLDTMREVAILFDNNTLLKHGCPEKILTKFRILKAGYDFHGIDHNLHIIQGAIPIDEIDKMLSIAGYLPQIIREKL